MGGGGVYKIVVEILEGYFSGQKNGNSREGGFCEIPSVVGVWIFFGITHYRLK